MELPASSRSPIDEVLSRLAGRNLKPRSGGGWTAQCPCSAHQGGDRNNSLAVDEGDGGKVIFKCFAGDSAEDVCRALGMEMQELFPKKEPPIPIKRSKAGRAKVTQAFEETKEKLVKEYDYTDENGKILYQNCRFSRLDGTKTFRLRRPDGQGGWIWSLGETQRVLYGLPALLQAIAAGRTIYIVEGEKDADRLLSLGLSATTSSSASSWEAAFAERLLGADVVIVQDMDKAGDSYRETVGASLQGKAKHCRVVLLPVPWSENHGLDVSDWFDKGGTADELQRLTEKAPEWTAGMLSHVPGPSSRVKIVAASDLQGKDFPPIKWAIPGILPEGLTLLAGRPKQGKSWLAFSIGLGIALGGRALGKIQVEAGSVLYLALEDRERRLQERMNLLLQQDKAPERLHLSVEWPRFDDGGLQEIDAWIKSRKDARLVIVDTLAWVKPPSRKGANQYEEDSKAVRMIKDLADRHAVAVLVVHHTRKAASEDPVDQISGTLGIAGAADGWLILQRKRGSDSAFLHVDGRDISESQELALQWHQESAAWTLLGNADEIRLSNAQKEIVEILRANDNLPMTPGALCKALQEENPDLTPNAVKMRLRKMADEGILALERHKYSIRDAGAVSTTRASTIRAPYRDRQGERESGEEG